MIRSLIARLVGKGLIRANKCSVAITPDLSGGDQSMAVVLMIHGRSDGPKAQKRFGEPRRRSFVAQKRPFNCIPAMEVADVVFSCSKFCWLI
jgi:hypothetical protein